MTSADPAAVIAAARGWLGTPYHDQASANGVGCDCLGLVRGVWRELHGAEPLPLPAYSRDWGETGTREPLADAARTVMLEISVTNLMPGALILFRMRAGAVAKHCGIVTTPDHFVHAYERTGESSRADSTPPGAGGSPSPSCSPARADRWPPSSSPPPAPRSAARSAVPSSASRPRRSAAQSARSPVRRSTPGWSPRWRRRRRSPASGSTPCRSPPRPRAR